MIKGLWWKLLGVLILLGVFIIGMKSPLGPGIDAISTNNFSEPEFIRIEGGTTKVLSIKGYNSFFATAKKNRVWLKNDSLALQANLIKVINETYLDATFDIPNTISTLGMTLVVDNEVDGFSVYPSAVSLVPSNSIDLTNTASFQPTSVISNLHPSTRYQFPFRTQLYETIRNTYFHVPLWFALMILFLTSMILSICFLVTENLKYDRMASSFTLVGTLFGVLGLLTGMVWAQYTWGAAWSGDIKQTMTAVALLICFAYFIFRNSLDSSPISKAKFSAAYNIFAFVCLIVLLFVIPRMVDSLHPGSGGNPAMGGEDLDNTMRMIFYPSIIGWTLLGVWLCDINNRYLKLKEKQTNVW